jgi:hypothetical protein
LVAIASPGCAKPDPSIIIAPNTVPYEQADWSYVDRIGKQITSDHYTIHTTITDDTLRSALPQVMETAYQNYRRLVPTAREPSENMRIYLFAQRGEFAHLARKLSPEKAQVLLQVRNGGYSEKGVTVIEYVSHEVTFPLMTHEGFHQYLHHCVAPNIPAWLNEGLAVYCEGFKGGATGIRELDPWHNPARRNALAEALLRDKLFPLDELLRINAGHVIGGSTRKIATYYAQVWALMNFLEQAEPDPKEKIGKYTARFAKMREALAAGDLESHAQAAHVASSRPAYSFGQSLFAAFIGDDFASIDREYVRFLRQRILNEK